MWISNRDPGIVFSTFLSLVLGNVLRYRRINVSSTLMRILVVVYQCSSIKRFPWNVDNAARSVATAVRICFNYRTYWHSINRLRWLVPPIPGWEIRLESTIHLDFVPGLSGTHLFLLNKRLDIGSRSGEIDWLVTCLTETVAVTGFLINVRQHRWKNSVGVAVKSLLLLAASR